MLDKTIMIGFMNQPVREYIDEYSNKRTGKFFYTKRVTKFKRKSTGEVLYGIYEECIEGVQYIWSGVQKSPAKILLKATELELIA